MAALLYRTLTFLILMATWVVFSGQLDAFHLSLGVVSSLFVAWISTDYLFEDRKMPLSGRARQASSLAVYIGWLLWQIVLANLHILRLALSPRGLDEVEPEIVRFRTILTSDFARFVLANSITLTPGTVTVDVIGDEFVVHSISKMTTAGLDGEMERRIAAIFEFRPSAAA